MGAGRGEAVDVLGEAVVRVVQPAVQVRHAVVGLATHVAPVGLLGQAGAERECNLGLEKPDNKWSNGDHQSIITNLMRELMKVAGTATPNQVARSQMNVVTSFLTMCLTILPSSLATKMERKVLMTSTRV